MSLGVAKTKAWLLVNEILVNRLLAENLIDAEKRSLSQWLDVAERILGESRRDLSPANLIDLCWLIKNIVNFAWLEPEESLALEKALDCVFSVAMEGSSVKSI